MKLSEIISELRDWQEIVADIPNTDVCEITDIATNLAYDIDRLANTLEVDFDESI